MALLASVAVVVLLIAVTSLSSGFRPGRAAWHVIENPLSIDAPRESAQFRLGDGSKHEYALHLSIYVRHPTVTCRYLVDLGRRGSLEALGIPLSARVLLLQESIPCGRDNLIHLIFTSTEPINKDHIISSIDAAGAAFSSKRER